MIKRAIIFGANGQFGQLFARKLKESGIYIIGYDLSLPAKYDGFDEFNTIDLTRSTDIIKNLPAADYILNLLPAVVAEKILFELATAKPDGLLIDLLPYKTKPFEQLNARSVDSEILSLHPLFAPDIGFDENNILAVCFNKNSRTEAFLSVLRSWGANVFEVGPGEHDEMTSIVQVAVHSAIVAFAQVLRLNHVNIDKSLVFATPPYIVLLSLIARMVKNNPRNYWDIQVEHPDGPKIRKDLIKAVELLDHNVAERNYAAFENILKELFASESEVQKFSKFFSDFNTLALIQQEHKIGK